MWADLGWQQDYTRLELGMGKQEKVQGLELEDCTAKLSGVARSGFRQEDKENFQGRLELCRFLSWGLSLPI